jgi:hypothetical protein
MAIRNVVVTTKIAVRKTMRDLESKPQAAPRGSAHAERDALVAVSLRLQGSSA